MAGGFSRGVAEVGEDFKHRTSSAPVPANSDGAPGAWAVGGRDGVRDGGPQASRRAAPERPLFVLPKGYRINGTLFIAGNVRIDGELSGRGLVAHKVEISVSGRVRCAVEASVILVEGVAQGGLQARDLLEIRAGGEVMGDVEAASLRVLPGAILSNARCAVGK